MVKNRGGFTLFEVMITMAISGMMLVTAVILFGAQQRKVQFAQSVRDLQQTLQDVMNDTATGYFPNSSYTCNPSPTGATLSNTVSKQGTNQGCLFMGKALVLKTNSMDIYPIIGNRSDASTAASTFQSSIPTVAAELVETKTYQFGIDLYEIWWGTTAAGKTSHIADGRLIVFGSTPNGTGTASSGDYFNSGTQKVNAYSSSAALPITENDNKDRINLVMRDANFSWPAGDQVTLCVEDGTAANRQYAGIVISGGSGGISVRTQLDSDAVVCS